MTELDMEQQWPFRRPFRRPEGDTVVVVGRRANRLMIEHPGAKDPRWVTTDSAEGWEPEP